MGKKKKIENKSHEISTYDEEFPAIGDVDALKNTLDYRLITSTIPITHSGSQTQRIFFSGVINMGRFNPKRHRAFISAHPGYNSSIIIDDAIYVNGHPYSGFSGLIADPRNHLGQNPSTAYRPVHPIEVTNDARRDSLWFIQLMDMGGYTYTSSRLYLRITAR